jgi:hypothetical protein
VYAGHFAAGLVIKSKAPRAPTWVLMTGVGLLDILFAPFVLLGLERVTLTPGVAPGFSLDYIDWSHSLLMSLVWAALFGVLFLRRGTTVALAAAVAVFSHFVLDLFMHPADLALWPNAAVHVGFGLWRSLPVGWWFVELAFIGACFIYYYGRSRLVGTFGYRPWAVLGVIIVLHVVNSPWLAP